jgi:threonylcarbamoyladenosine tRNA methylthiotransferase MtaB
MKPMEKTGLSRPGRFSFITLGCKSNQYDSAAMAADLLLAGLKKSDPADADVIVINTCMVTTSAEAQCRKAVRHARRENPGARLVVSGCMPSGVQHLHELLPEADHVLEPQDKGKLAGLLGLGCCSREKSNWSDWPDDPAVNPFEKDRAFLKIQDGCDASCSYCVVPKVRGSSRSLEPGRVLDAVRSLMESGHLEVVLSGIHLGQYGGNLRHRITLEGLLELLVKEDLPGRVRLTSIEPLEITRSLVDIIGCSDGFICRHVHVPIQSGSDRILAGMERPYARNEMVDALLQLHRKIPGIGIGCDVICGFPGETGSDFDLTEGVIDELEIPFVHAFPYSSRPGTKASLLKDDVPHGEKKERVKRLRSIALRNRAQFAEKQVGSFLTVALESGKGSGGVTWGLTDNYLRVKVQEKDGLRPGDLVDVFITGSKEDVLEGKPVDRK